MLLRFFRYLLLALGVLNCTFFTIRYGLLCFGSRIPLFLLDRGDLPGIDVGRQGAGSDGRISQEEGRISYDVMLLMI